jgi:hypothetical protein
LRQTRRVKKIPKTVLKTRLKTKDFGFRKIPCGVFAKPLNKGIFSDFGRFIEDYLRNLTCWEKLKNRFGLSATKLSKNRRFFSKDKIVLGSYEISCRCKANEKYVSEETNPNLGFFLC